MGKGHDFLSGFMSFSRRCRILALVLSVLADSFATGALAQQAATPVTLLPQSFGGWQIEGAAATSSNPATADPANAAVLKEYRFTDFASATYTRDDGRTLKIRAAQFEDASGAFGAYTFYLQPDMRSEDIGEQGASLGERVLFYRGSVLVDAVFTKESPMSGAELRELAGDLPKPSGSAANLPAFIEFMPRRQYVANTQKYVMGPAALAALSSPVPAGLVDFKDSAEVSLGNYSTASGQATLMLISYPTPQLAATHLRMIDAAHHLAQPQAGIEAIENSGTFFDKRTGPLVAIASGPISESDAKSLLGMVNYEANVTWNTPTDSHEVHDLYVLILNVVILCAILGVLAIVAGVAFGGFRIWMKRLFPGKVFDRPEQIEFISLRLTETITETIVEIPSSQEGNEGGRHRPRNSS
jgi:hypothetical protein